MKKQKKQMIILLVICLICVGGFVFLQNADLEKKEEAVSGENIRLDVFDAANAAEIMITGENELHFVKKEDVWYAVEDESLKLDQALVNSLVTNLGKIYTDTIIGEVENLEEFGLKEPVLTVNVVQNDGTKAEIRAGLYNDIAYGYYIQVDGDANVYLADSFVIGSCRKGLDEFLEIEIAE